MSDSELGHELSKKDIDSHDSEPAFDEESDDEWEEICALVQVTPEIPEADLEFELEDAFSDQMPYIVIDHRKLGGDTAAAISVGNFMHKGAVLSALLCIAAGPVAKRPTVGIPAGLFGVVCAFFYDISWAYDPCCKYQVVPPSIYHQELPFYEHLEAKRLPEVTVLVRRDDRIRRRLHNTLALLSLVYVAERAMRWYRA